VPYRIQISSEAAKYIKKLDKPTRERIAAACKDLELDPLNNSGAIGNSDPPARSCRVGSYRMVIHINDAGLVVLVVLVNPRGQVYSRA
jgi:mRNA interferase RelE/StbE